MAKKRQEFLESLASAVEVAQPDGRLDWMAIRRTLFCILHGLPSPVAIGLGCRMVRRYLPLFKIRHPNVLQIDRVLLSIEGFLETGHLASDGLAVNMLDGPVPRIEELQFLQAIGHLRQAISDCDRSPGLTATLVEKAIYACVLQRRETVWAADDPAAAAAALEFQRLDELVMMAGTSGGAREHQAKLTVMKEFLIGRSVDENVAAIAVERREWHIVCDWLRDIVTRYPDISDESAELLSLDFNRWKENGGSWEEVED